MRRFMLLGIVAIAALIAHSAYAASKAAYVGNTGCKCHKPEMVDWGKSVHGSAFDILLAANRSSAQNKNMTALGLDPKKDYDKDAKCLPCHTTGYGADGGYEDASSPADLKGVGCEMCHGAGSEYRVLHKEKEETFTRAEAEALGEVYPPSEKMCRKCHDNKDSDFSSAKNPDYAFDFTSAIEKSKAWHKKQELIYKH